ncbi:RNA-binding family protein [Perilla frutescens var. frutescens]|nr:RNA-binding family protein [Perilla frutescens var. frutescens]
MAASLHSLSLSLAPQTVSLVAASASLFAPSSLKPLTMPRHVLSLSSIGSYAHTAHKFVRNVAISSDLDAEVEEGEYEGSDSTSEGRHFSPDLKLFVGNLPFNVDSSRLAGLFEQAGNCEMVEVIYDKATGRSRGFGFVTMSTVEEVEAAAQQFNGYEFQGRVLRVSSGPPPAKNDNFSSRGPRGGTSIDNTNRLYVGNLAWGVDNLTLETLFSEQGKVKEATVVYDRETGRSRGFGFVAYGSAEEVDNAIRALDGMAVRTIFLFKLEHSDFVHLNPEAFCIRMSRLKCSSPKDVVIWRLTRNGRTLYLHHLQCGFDFWRLCLTTPTFRLTGSGVHRLCNLCSHVVEFLLCSPLDTRQDINRHLVRVRKFSISAMFESGS